MGKFVSEMGLKMEQPKKGAYDLDGIVGRRDLPEYESNPSLPVASQNAKIGTRRIMNKAGDRCMIVSEAGEVVAPAGFHEIIECDRTQFIKVYTGGVAALNDLSAAGARVFRKVYDFILKNPGTDQVVLHHKTVKSIPKTTFERGLTELLNREILYRSSVAGVYYLNVNYVFNGDRLALIKEYRLKSAIEESEPQETLPF